MGDYNKLSSGNIVKRNALMGNGRTGRIWEVYSLDRQRGKEGAEFAKHGRTYKDTTNDRKLSAEDAFVATELNRTSRKN